MYICMYVCMYACMYQELLKTTTNSLCVCAHLANKADSDSDSENGPCLLSLELGSVCAAGFVGTEAGDTSVGFVVANSSTYCNISARGYLVGPEP